MRIYLYPVNEAMLHFPIIAGLLTIPYILYSYIRYGSVSLLRSIVLFSAIFYLLCAFYLVTLPLPDPKEVARGAGMTPQLKPFNFIRNFLRYSSLDISDPSTYIRAMKESWFYQPVFNVLLTLPFGAYLSYYFRRGFIWTIILSFLLSLFFELTQLTGIFGIYEKAYRTFDVDDLMLNTLGGALGYGLGRAAASVLPNRNEMDEDSYRRAEKVTYTRRFFALCVDAVVLTGLSLGLTLLGLTISFTSGWLLFFAYFVGLGALFSGRTPGKMLVHIRIVSVRPGLPLALRLLLRYGLLFAAYQLFLWLTRVFARELTGGQTLWALLAYAAVGLFILLDLVIGLRRQKRLWYEMLSGTEHVNSLHKRHFAKNIGADNTVTDTAPPAGQNEDKGPYPEDE